jgi:hydrogenase maturation protease
MTDDKKPILILGLGNLLLKDEGIGVHIVQQMKDMTLPEDVEIMDGGTMGLDLVYYVEGRKKVIVIDTVKAGHPPGTLYRFTEKSIVYSQNVFRTAHGINFTDVIRYVQASGKKPEEIIFIGAEPEDMNEGIELSPKIAAKIPKIIELVLREIEANNN